MMPSELSTVRPRRTPRVHLQRRLLEDCIAERASARLSGIVLDEAVLAAGLREVPGWRGLGAFVQGPLAARLAIAIGAEGTAHVLARIAEVTHAVEEP